MTGESQETSGTSKQQPRGSMLFAPSNVDTTQPATPPNTPIASPQKSTTPLSRSRSISPVSSPPAREPSFKEALFDFLSTFPETFDDLSLPNKLRLYRQFEIYITTGHLPDIFQIVYETSLEEDKTEHHRLLAAINSPTLAKLWEQIAANTYRLKPEEQDPEFSGKHPGKPKTCERWLQPLAPHAVKESASPYLKLKELTPFQVLAGVYYQYKLDRVTTAAEFLDKAKNMLNEMECKADLSRIAEFIYQAYRQFPDSKINELAQKFEEAADYCPLTIGEEIIAIVIKNLGPTGEEAKKEVYEDQHQEYRLIVAKLIQSLQNNLPDYEAKIQENKIQTATTGTFFKNFACIEQIFMDFIDKKYQEVLNASKIEQVHIDQLIQNAEVMLKAAHSLKKSHGYLGYHIEAATYRALGDLFAFCLDKDSTLLGLNQTFTEKGTANPLLFRDKHRHNIKSSMLICYAQSLESRKIADKLTPYYRNVSNNNKLHLLERSTLRYDTTSYYQKLEDIGVKKLIPFIEQKVRLTVSKILDKKESHKPLASTSHCLGRFSSH